MIMHAQSHKKMHTHIKRSLQELKESGIQHSLQLFQSKEEAGTLLPLQVVLYLRDSLLTLEVITKLTQPNTSISNHSDFFLLHSTEPLLLSSRKNLKSYPYPYSENKARHRFASFLFCNVLNSNI